MKVDNYQVWARDLFSGACYAACISYMSGKDDPIDITRDILNGVENKFIEPSGYVSAPHLFANFCIGKKGFYTDVIQKPYKPTNYEQIVCWEYGHKTHFVIMKDGQIVFDPWPNSETVRLGNPVSVREYV